jgi:hypothetical protein
MCDHKGPCQNVKVGFDCMVKWEKEHPGETCFYCEYCGIYTASDPRCNKCEKSE